MNITRRPDLLATLAGTVLSVAATGAVAALTSRRAERPAGLSRYLRSLAPLRDHRRDLPDWRSFADRLPGKPVEAGLDLFRSAREVGQSGWKAASNSLAGLDLGSARIMPGSVNPLTAALAGGAVLAAAGAFADFLWKPAALEPPKRSGLPARSTAGGLAILAIGLAATALAAHASTSHRRSSRTRWFG